MSHAKENNIEEGLGVPPPFDSQQDDKSNSASSSARLADPNVSVDDSLTAALAVVARLEAINDCAEPSSLPTWWSNSPIMTADTDIDSEQSELQEGEVPSEPEVHDVYGIEPPLDIGLEIGSDGSNMPPANTDIPKKIEASANRDQTVAEGGRDIERGLAQIPNLDPSDDPDFPIFDGRQEVDVMPEPSPASTTFDDGDRPRLPQAMTTAMTIATVHATQGKLEIIGSGDDSSLSSVRDHGPLHLSIPDDVVGDGDTEPPFIGMMEDSIGDSNAPPPVPTDNIATAIGPVSPITDKEGSGNVIKSPPNSKGLSGLKATIAAAKRMIAHERSVPAYDIKSKDEHIVEECIAADPSSSNMLQDNGTRETTQESPNTASIETDMNDTFYTASDQVDEETEGANKKVAHGEAIISSCSKDKSANDYDKSNQQEGLCDDAEEPDLNDTFDTAADQDVDKDSENGDEEVPQEETVDHIDGIDSSEDIGTNVTNHANFNQQEEQTSETVTANLSNTCKIPADQRSDKRAEDANEEIPQEGSCIISTNNNSPIDTYNFNTHADQFDGAIEEDLSDCELTQVQKLAQINEETSQYQEDNASRRSGGSVDAIDQANIRDQGDDSNGVPSAPQDNESEDGLVLPHFSKILSNVERDAQDVNYSAAAPPAQPLASDNEVVVRGVNHDADTVPLTIPAASVTLLPRLEVKDDNTRLPSPQAMDAAARPEEISGSTTTMAGAIGPEKSNLASGLEMICDDGPDPPLSVRGAMDGKSDDKNQLTNGLGDIPYSAGPIIGISDEINDPLIAQAVVQTKMEESTDHGNTTTSSGTEPTIAPSIESIGDMCIAPVSINSTSFEDSSHRLLSAYHTPTGPNVDEEAQISGEEHQEEEDRNPRSNISSETNDQGQSEYGKPNAYVPDDVALIDTIAEPLLPWWKQRRQRMLFGVICFFAIAAAIVIGESFSRDVRTATKVISVAITHIPSTSPMPTFFEPITSPPTLAPTEVPSSSQMPSYIPAQLPFSSLVPTSMPSYSVMPSVTFPSSSAPAISLLPSFVPTSSPVPSPSTAPSHVPTISSSPTTCHHIRIIIMTNGANIEGFEEDVTSWELYDKQSGKVVLQGGQFKEDQIDQYDIECIEGSDFVFNINNSGGNGFGDCATCAYFVFVDDVYIGGMAEFHYNDRLYFTVPLYQREPNEDLVSNNGIPVCGGDLIVSIQMDDHPEEITWDLANEEGDIVLRGGPYEQIDGFYREFACLSDGKHTFTIYGSEKTAGTAQGGYIIQIHWNSILVQSDLNFGASESTTFVIGAQNEEALFERV